ncbi:MAG: NTP transferase domain-containing protein, partial [Lentisphaerae bacterium]|nr:NTP transferase domain-containing protein [Lentisphaerota bacterium]
MYYPTKAIVLAAGLGTRLRPLSLDVPKPLMPFWGRPLLELALEMLSAWGVREVLINLHHQPDSILQYLRQRSAAGQSPLRICLSFEPTILGTGGALQRAGWFLDQAPFWIINADIVADLDPAPLLEAFAAPRTLAALWLHPTRGPRSVEMRRGLISTFNSRRPGTAGTYTFCGLHLISPAIGRYLPAGSSSIIAAYALALAARRRLRGVCLPGSYWADVGTPASYLEAHAEAWQGLQQGLPRGRLVSAAAQQRQRAWQGRGVRIQGFAAIGTGVRIAKGARLSQAVLWDGARIASAAHIERAIIGRRTDVRGRVTRLAMRADLILPPAQRSADPQLALALARLRWDPAKVSVIPFAARGSERVFTRLKYAKASAIMISYSTQRRENTLYAAQTRFLQSLPWPVPAILVDMPAQQFLVVEDLGDRSLQHLAQSARPATLERYYRLVLSSLYQLHQRGASAARRRQLELMAPFTAEVYRWERELFAHHFLERRLGLAPARIQGILRELAGVAQALL